MEELLGAMFSMWSLQRLYSKDQWKSFASQKSGVDSHESEVRVGGYKPRVLSCIVRSRYQAMACGKQSRLSELKCIQK
jgi:hypothetical protein